MPVDVSDVSKVAHLFSASTHLKLCDHMPSYDWGDRLNMKDILREIALRASNDVHDLFHPDSITSSAPSCDTNATDDFFDECVRYEWTAKPRIGFWVIARLAIASWMNKLRTRIVPNTQPFPFTRLPTELRLKILNHYFQDIRATLLARPDWVLPGYQIFPRYRVLSGYQVLSGYRLLGVPSLAIEQVNHEIGSEATIVRRECMRGRITIIDDALLRRVVPALREDSWYDQIRQHTSEIRLIQDTKGRDCKLKPPLLKELIAAFPQLQTFRLCLNRSCDLEERSWKETGIISNIVWFMGGQTDGDVMWHVGRGIETTWDELSSCISMCGKLGCKVHLVWRLNYRLSNGESGVTVLHLWLAGKPTAIPLRREVHMPNLITSWSEGGTPQVKLEGGAWHPMLKRECQDGTFVQLIPEDILKNLGYDLGEPVIQW